jgi:hypothetical protein
MHGPVLLTIYYPNEVHTLKGNLSDTENTSRSFGIPVQAKLSETCALESTCHYDSRRGISN